MITLTFKVTPAIADALEAAANGRGLVGVLTIGENQAGAPALLERVVTLLEPRISGRTSEASQVTFAVEAGLP